MPTTLQQRFDAIDPSRRPHDLAIVPGIRADYLALKPHHYRPGHPMTMTRILSIYDRTPSASDRFLSRSAKANPVAVLVESLPALSCRLRDEALGGRYGHLRPRPRATLLNQEIRCISRVIVDPRWRGLGLAVRLVRHALSTATTRYTEALAVMGRVSPFFERAGMRAYERPALEAEQRALAALCFAGIAPRALALPAAVEKCVHALPDQQRAVLVRELQRWYRTAAGRGALRSPSLTDLLSAAQRSLLSSPIYYLKENTHVQPAPLPDTGLAH